MWHVRHPLSLWCTVSSGWNGGRAPWSSDRIITEMSLRKEGSEERGPVGVEEWRGGGKRDDIHVHAPHLVPMFCCLAFSTQLPASGRAASRNVNLQRTDPCDVCFHQLAFITAYHTNMKHISVWTRERFLALISVNLKQTNLFAHL